MHSPGTTDVCELYLELAGKVREGLVKLDPYFETLADAMVAWVAAWRQLNPTEAQ